MFHGWENYFLMIGSSAAALIGLLFVVASLSGGRESNTIRRGTHIYSSPIVFHLGLVVLISAIALIPQLSRSTICSVIIICALTGMVYTAIIAKLLHSDPPPPGVHWTDFWFYGIGPFVIYFILAVSGGSVWFASFHVLTETALALLALLMLSIRNAWDLITYLAPQAKD